MIAGCSIAQIGIRATAVLKKFMGFSRGDVAKLAILARLRLTAEEEKLLTDQLDQILGYMERLNRLETSQVEPFSHVLNAVNAFREDRVTNQPDAESLLASAPDRDQTFFKVPKIIE